MTTHLRTTLSALATLGALASGCADDPKGTDLPFCNALEQRGQPVPITYTPEPAPKPAGGAVADGTYVLTAYIAHSPGNRATTEPGSRRETWVVKDGRYSIVIDGVDSFRANGSHRYEGAMKASPGAVILDFDGTCSNVMGEKNFVPMAYSATPTALTLLVMSQFDSTVEMVLTKL
jgi:hypothetical protein